MNLIDRDKLILYLNDWAYSIAPDYVREDVLVEEVIRGIEYNTIMRVIEAIDEVATVNQWIPCEERLPKENEEVYVTLINYTGERMTSVDVFENGKFYHHSKNVIAWQPLPEPYEG
jgi:hypothetical protein